MPFTHTCTDCAAPFDVLNDLRDHQDNTGHAHSRTAFERQPRHVDTGFRRTVHCARCNAEVALTDLPLGGTYDSQPAPLCPACVTEGPLPAAKLLPRGTATPHR